MNNKKRGISLGTVVMLCITVVVTGALFIMLPKLWGDTKLEINAADIVASLDLPGLTDIDVNGKPYVTAVNNAETDVSAATGNNTQTNHTPEPQSQATATPAPVSNRSIKITAAGSVLIQSTIRKSVYYKDTDDYDLTQIGALLKGKINSDLSFLTLQNVIVPDAKYSDFNTHTSVAQMLRNCGFKAIGLGFPAVMEYGINGLQSTANTLNSQNLRTFGAFAAEAQSVSPVILTANGVKVAILHYTTSLSSGSKKKIKNDTCSWAVPVYSDETVLSDIKKARSNGAQIVIVSLNWGKDNATKPTSEQKKIAQYIANAGADLIIGSGSNAVQTAEYLQGSNGNVLCCYSMGCLISDSRDQRNTAGLILDIEMSVDRAGNVSCEKITPHPTYVWRYKQDGAYHYMITYSGEAAPDGMQDDSVKAMKKAYSIVQNALKDSPIHLPDLQ